MELAIVRCVFLLVTFLFSIPPGNTELPIKDGAFEEMRLTEDVGHTLFERYRWALGKTDLSSLSNRRKNLTVTNWSTCIRDIAALKNNPEKMIKYLDAAGKPKSGFLRGNLFWVGSFGECQDISDAHYCLSTLNVSVPSSNTTIPGKFTWGACFPESCNDRNIGILLNYLVFPEVENATGVKIYNKGTLCPGKAPYTTGVKVTLAFCGVLLFFCLVGTILELVIEAYSESNAVTSAPPSEPTINKSSPVPSSIIVQNQDDVSTAVLNSEDAILLPPEKSTVLHRVFSVTKEVLLDLFLCFSLVRNTKKIFDTKISPRAITSINGIRVISISWVILGHTFAIFLVTPFSVNKGEVIKDSKLLTIMPVINGYYSVDSFFFLSGLLVAYTCFRKMKNADGKFNWIFFYVHRFWRLTPSYMFVILFSVQLKRFMSDGPLWYSQYKDPVCSKYWWTNLLYINNFYPSNQTCIGWTWYLANDMQFFVITPPLLIVLFKVGRRGLVLPLVLLLASSVTIAAIIGYYDLDPLSSLKITHPRTPEFMKKSNQYGKYVYIKPYCRIQPYLVGFILGYFMYRSYGRTHRPGWIVALVGWAVAATVGMLLVYGPHDSILPGAEEWNKAENILYGTFERLLWGVVLAWVTYACHYGCGGLVQRFLSARFWIPLSRLTYSVYLIHIIVLILMFVGPEGTVHYDFYTVSYYFIACVALSYGAGFILAVAIEFPCDNLENMAIKYFKDAFVR